MISLLIKVENNFCDYDRCSNIMENIFLTYTLIYKTQIEAKVSIFHCIYLSLFLNLLYGPLKLLVKF